MIGSEFLALQAAAEQAAAAGGRTKPQATRLRVYSWSDSGQSNIFTMLPADPGQTIPVARQGALSRWSKSPSVERCLLLAPMRHQIAPVFNKHIKTILKKGLSSRPLSRWWNSYLWMLKKNELTPHRLAICVESGFGYWHRPGNRVNAQDRRSPEILEAFADEEAFAALPSNIQALDPNDIAMGGSREAMILWNAFCTLTVSRWIRKTFTDPFLHIFPNARASNYQDAEWRFEVKDQNGWPRTSRMSGNDASPSLYDKDASRNLLYLDSIRRDINHPPVPWVPYPSYNGRDAWEDTIHGCYEHGVRDFLYWNPFQPDKKSDDDAFASSVFTALNGLDAAA
jgi:hypothetical protein